LDRLRIDLHCKIPALKRFGNFIKIFAIAALAFCLTAVAQEQNGWQFDSFPANSSVSKPDDQQVYEILLKMLDRWNAHDIEGLLLSRREMQSTQLFPMIASPYLVESLSY
jgi:hypothetical protein